MAISGSIPEARGALPILGRALQLLRDPFSFLNSLPAQGELVTIKVGRFGIIMFCDPDLTRRVLVDDRIFDKSGPIYDRVRESIGHGVASCPHDDHRRLRRLIQPAFDHDRLVGYAETMAAQINEAIQTWRDEIVLDVLAELKALNVRILMRTIFADVLPPQLSAIW